MKYFCNFCGEQLRPGYSYTVECECKNCYLFFSKDGLVGYRFYFFEDGVDWCILKKPSEKDTFLFNRPNGTSWKVGKAHPEYDNYGLIDKPLISGKFNLIFDNGVPQVYKLFEKMKNLIVFS